MKFADVALLAVAAELPEMRLSSEAIEHELGPIYQRFGVSVGRLELMTGIRERRLFPQDTPRPSTWAARAGARALAEADCPRDAIGLLIHASVSRDFLEPATASIVHDALGLSPSAQVFDLSNACLGVLNGLIVAASQIEAGQIDAALIVAAEHARPLVEATLRGLLADPDLTRAGLKRAFASLTIGSGAAAVVIGRRSRFGGHPVHGAAVRAATAHHALCRGGGADHADAGFAESTALSMDTDSEALLAAGLTLARENYANYRRAFPAPTLSIAHQVGRAHARGLYAALGLDLEQGFFSYPEFGNVGSVSVPLTLAQAAAAGRVQSGDEVALLGIGSGLNSIMVGVGW